MGEVFAGSLDVHGITHDGDHTIPRGVVEPKILDVGELPQVKMKLVDRNQVQGLRCGGVKLRRDLEYEPRDEGASGDRPSAAS